MLNEKRGYNVTTDSIRSKTTKNSYVKAEAGTLNNKISVTTNSLTLNNQYDFYDWNNTTDKALTLNIPKGLNESAYARNILIYIHALTSNIRAISYSVDSSYTKVDPVTQITVPVNSNCMIYVSIMGTNIIINRIGDLTDTFVTKEELGVLQANHAYTKGDVLLSSKNNTPYWILCVGSGTTGSESTEPSTYHTDSNTTWGNAIFKATNKANESFDNMELYLDSEGYINYRCNIATE